MLSYPNRNRISWLYLPCVELEFSLLADFVQEGKALALLPKERMPRNETRILEGFRLCLLMLVFFLNNLQNNLLGFKNCSVPEVPVISFCVLSPFFFQNNYRPFPLERGEVFEKRRVDHSMPKVDKTKSAVP